MPPTKKFVSHAFKFMVAAGSMAGTLGIWNELANKELVQAASVEPTPQIIDFKPLPTVMPIVTVQFTTSNNTLSTTTIREVTVETTVQSNPTSVSNTQIITIPAPSAVTTTSSSRK